MPDPPEDGPSLPDGEADRLDADLPPMPPPIPRRATLPQRRDDERIGRALEHIARSGCSVAEAAKAFELSEDELERNARAEARAHSGRVEAAVTQVVDEPEPGDNGDLRDRREIESADRERFVQNWDQAGNEAALEEEPSGFEGLVAGIAPLRWLLGTERRRLVLGGVVCAVAVAGVAYLSTHGPLDSPPPAKLPPKPDPMAGSGLPGFGDSERAKEIGLAFLAASSWRERLPWVRHPERAQPRMEQWYQDAQHSDGPVEHGEFYTAAGTENHGMPFVILEAEDTATRLPLVLAVDFSGDQPKVDWESHVHHQPMPWKQFKSERPTEPLWFRVRAEPSNYHPEPYDEETYFSLRLTSPTGVVGLNAFVPRESALAVDLVNIINLRQRALANMMLKLAFDPETDSKSEVLIHGIIDGWIEP